MHHRQVQINFIQLIFFCIITEPLQLKCELSITRGLDEVPCGLICKTVAELASHRQAFEKIHSTRYDGQKSDAIQLKGKKKNRDWMCTGTVIKSGAPCQFKSYKSSVERHTITRIHCEDVFIADEGNICTICGQKCSSKLEFLFHLKNSPHGCGSFKQKKITKKTK
jgi:hypothetical protein